MTEREEYVGYYASDPFMVDITRTPMKVPILTNEPIVRCRDCEHYMSVTASCQYFSIESYDRTFNCDTTVYFPVEPNGFCKWARRKDEAA